MIARPRAGFRRLNDRAAKHLHDFLVGATDGSLGLLVGFSRPPVIGADLVPAQAHTAFPQAVPGANLGWNDRGSVSDHKWLGTNVNPGTKLGPPAVV